MKLDNGIATFGSSWEGFGIQVYWPAVNLEWCRVVTTREKIFPSGFCIRLGTTVRLVIDPVEKHYALAANLAGFGAGIQYLKPATRPDVGGKEDKQV